MMRRIQPQARRGAAAFVLCVFSAALPVRAMDAPRLRAFLKQATWVVSGTVTDLREYDDGRLAVASLGVGEVLQSSRGNTPTDELIEMRDLPLPDVFEQGTLGIAFLRPAKRNSYLNEHLSGRSYAELVDARAAWVVADSAASLRAMNEIVAALVADSKGRAATSEKRALSPRELVFRLVGAYPPLFVEDGADSLGSIPGLASSLSGEEQATIESSLKRDDLPVRVRQRLIEAIAANDLRQLVPALREVGAPELQEASWKALRELGAPMTDEALDDSLKSPNAATRIAALHEILAHDPNTGVARVAPLALTDADREVRIAAIDALGQTKSSAAVAPLETIYVADDIETRQASARALLAVGGAPATEAFSRLAFTGSLEGQRLAVFALLSLGVARDDPRMLHIVETHSDEKIVELLKHGLKHGH